MQNRSFPGRTLVAFLIIIFAYGCTKLDTTTLGGDLVAVDNINTFGDTLDVISTQGPLSYDSSAVDKNENHVIGNITNDPIFGTTEAAIFAQFKPSFYPFYFGNPGDTVKSSQSVFAGLDSVFVTLSYKGLWGDSSGMTPQQFTVTQIIDEDFRIYNDSLRKLNYQPQVTSGPVLGEAFITPQIARKKVFIANGGDSVQNQIRIKFNAAGMSFINTLYMGQDTSLAGPNNAFRNDSIFRKFLHGFAIRATGGNTLYYVNLEEANSRLEFHIKKIKNGIKDTIVQIFPFYSVNFGTTKSSSAANYVKRNYIGAPAATPSADYIYMQTSPGTFAHLSIPELTGYSNRIIHRAFLIAEQVPFNPATDNQFTPPPYLYLDLKDTSTAMPQRYKPVYFDLNQNFLYNPDATNTGYHPFPFGNIDLNTFGGDGKIRYEASGTKFTRYEINLTRYVQHIVSNGFKNYDLRLYSPYNYTYPQYGTKYLIPFYNPVALGSVRLGSGTNATHKMRMVVIYSKLK